MEKSVWHILLSVLIPSLVYVYGEIYNPLVYILGTPVSFLLITYWHDSLEYQARVRKEVNLNKARSIRNEYAHDWKDISRRVRSERGFVCEDCGVKLSDSTWLLHTHHQNRNKSDNREQNLCVLCVQCHSDQPGHFHMKADFAKQILQVSRIRNSQFGKIRIFA